MSQADPSTRELKTQQRLRRRRMVLGLLLSGAVHLLILGLPNPPEPEKPTEFTLELEFDVASVAVPEPAADKPPPPLPQAAAETTGRPPTDSESERPEEQENSDPQDLVEVAPREAAAQQSAEELSVATVSEPTGPPPPLQNPDLVTRLLAAPLERDPLPGPFDPPEAADPAFVEFRYPERESMITMLTPRLPDVPFADPGLDLFMYSPDWQGSLHRGFDKITPEFGYTTNTGFMVRCRWLIIVVGCGWGRSLYSPGMDAARQAREAERRARDAAREAREAEREGRTERETAPLNFPLTAPDGSPAAPPERPPPSAWQ